MITHAQLTQPQIEILESLNARPMGAGKWLCSCPCKLNHKNGDANPSLSILLGDDGWLHPKCHTGCDRDEVRKAVGVDQKYWGPGVSADTARRPRPKLVAIYPYYTERGYHAYDVCKYEPKTFRRRRKINGFGTVWGTDEGEYVETRPGNWIQSVTAHPELRRHRFKACPKVPYRLLDWLTVPPTHPVFLVEGEKDADNLHYLGLLATTLPGGSTSEDRERLARYLTGRRVVLVPDNDEAGQKYFAQNFAHLVTNRVRSLRVICWDLLKPKGYDISDFILETAGQFGWPLKDERQLRHVRADVINFVESFPEYKS